MSWPRLDLPLSPPYPPMEAKLVAAIPSGSGWQYEPKWDGFRALVYRDEDTVVVQSKAGQDLTRYFPEIVDAIRELPPRRLVLDGELAVPAEEGFSFERILQRIHPADSRVRRLARETPAILIVFDLLVDPDGGLLTAAPLAERRARLEELARRALRRDGSVRLSPATRELAVAEAWLAHTSPGIDGVVAKRLDLDYRSGDRTGMNKIKRVRTADCVVGGFRRGSDGGIGSILLGLHDDQGILHHAGFCAAFPAPLRRELPGLLEPLAGGSGFTGSAPGPSRWSGGRSAEWVPVAPVLVVEVEYRQFSERHFRHGTRFLRWRPDKRPADCTFDQLPGFPRSTPAPSLR